MPIASLREGEAIVVGRVISVKERRGRGRFQLVTAMLSDETGTIEAKWFGQRYRRRQARARRPGVRRRPRRARAARCCRRSTSPRTSCCARPSATKARSSRSTVRPKSCRRRQIRSVDREEPRPPDRAAHRRAAARARAPVRLSAARAGVARRARAARPRRGRRARASASSSTSSSRSRWPPR